MAWTRAPLAELCTLGPQYGLNSRAVSASGTRPRYVRITDIAEDGQLLSGSVVEADTDDIASYELLDGDLLFARSGATVGKTYLHHTVDGPAVFAGYLIRFRPDPHFIEPQFLFYFTRSSEYTTWVASRRRVAAQPNINGPEYASLQIPLPPLSEQRRIVEILDQIDRLRRLRAEADAKSERILPALFIDMFGDPASNPMGWETATFDEVFQDITAECPKLQRKDYLPVGRFPVVDQGKALVAGYSDDDDLNVHHDLPVVVFGDHTRVVKYIDFPFVAGADGSRIFKVRADSATAFAALHLALQPIPNLGYSRHMRVLRRMQFMQPPAPLQHRFAVLAARYGATAGPLESAREQINKLISVTIDRAFSGRLTDRWRESRVKDLLAELENQGEDLNKAAAAAS